MVHGETRYDIVSAALQALDSIVTPILQTKQSVLIKPNLVDPSVSLAITHPDTVRAILDFVVQRFNGPIVIGEGSAYTTADGFAALGLPALIRSYAPRDIKLVCFHEEGQYQVLQLIDRNTHIMPVRLAARLFDPAAFIISTAMLKTHNVVVATLSVKNMVMGAPLHHNSSDTTGWSDKSKFHEGARVSNYSMFLNAQKQRPFWGMGVIDGFEGMEGDGPTAGTLVPSRVAMASTDLIALDRVGVEAMGIDPTHIGYLNYLWQAGLGQFDLTKIDMWGGNIGNYSYTYKLHSAIDQELMWMGDVPDTTYNPIL